MFDPIVGDCCLRMWFWSAMSTLHLNRSDEEAKSWSSQVMSYWLHLEIWLQVTAGNPQLTVLMDHILTGDGSRNRTMMKSVGWLPSNSSACPHDLLTFKSCSDQSYKCSLLCRCRNTGPLCYSCSCSFQLHYASLSHLQEWNLDNSCRLPLSMKIRQLRLRWM